MKTKSFLTLLLISCLMLACAPRESANTTDDGWVSLFNGKNLDGWDIKFSGYALNENYLNTFRVEDGKLVVSYENYEGFNNEFGHIYYNQPFSSYKLSLEYRFMGDQVPGGAGWAYRNNGVMFHSQSAQSIELNQDFPVSIEAQLLGGDGINERTTGTVCTPGTTVAIDGIQRYEHCLSSNSATFHGDQWVKFELVVFADSLVHHIIQGDTVMTYTNLRLEDSDLPLSRGYIALQAESHPTEFRNIKILEIK